MVYALKHSQNELGSFIIKPVLTDFVGYVRISKEHLWRVKMEDIYYEEF